MDWDQKIPVTMGEKKHMDPSSSSSMFGLERRFTRDTGGETPEKMLEKSQNKIVKALDFIIQLSLFAIFLGVPLFFTNLTYQGVAFEKQLYFYFWILLAVVAWGTRSGYVGEMKLRKTPLDIPILAFWLFYLIATIFSIDRWHSFVGFFGDPSRGFVSITAMIVLYYMILSNFSLALFKWLLRAIMISGGVAVIFELIRIYNLNPFLPESMWNSLPLNVIGSLQSSAIFASFMVFIFMTAVLKLRSDETINAPKKNIYTGVLIALIAASLLLVLTLYSYLPINGYFPLIGIVIGAAFFLIFVLAKIVRPQGAWTLFPMVVFVLILAFLMIGKISLSQINLPLNVSVPYGTAAEIAKSSVKDSFFMGYGPGSYGYAFSKFLPKHFDNLNLRFFAGEGMIFESISTLGAIGTILAGIAGLTFLGTSIFLLYREKDKNKIYSLGILSAALVLIINALVAQAEASMVILLAGVATMAFGILFHESAVKEKYLNFSLKTSPKFALTLAFISLLIFASVAFLFVFFGKMYVADLYMGKAVRTGKVSEEDSLTPIAKAIQLNNKEGRYFIRLGQEYIVLANQEMLKGESQRDVNKIRAYLDAGNKAGVLGRDRMKNDVTIVESLAQIYENSGVYVLDALALAEQQYQKALELEPNNPAFHVRIGQIKMKMASASEKTEEKKKFVEEAKEEFEKALDVRNAYDAGYYNLAVAQEALGQLDEAIDTMTKAVTLQRNNVNYVFNLGRMLQARGKGDDNKNAEILFKRILGVNNKEINAHFNLGLLYEKTDRKSEAIAEYEKVLELLPAGSDTTKTQIGKMIDNIRRGVENTPESLGLNQASNSESGQ